MTTEVRRFLVSFASLCAVVAVYLTPAPAAAMPSCQFCLSDCPGEDFCEMQQGCGSDQDDCEFIGDMCDPPNPPISIICWEG